MYLQDLMVSSNLVDLLMLENLNYVSIFEQLRFQDFKKDFGDFRPREALACILNIVLAKGYSYRSEAPKSLV